MTEESSGAAPPTPVGVPTDAALVVPMDPTLGVPTDFGPLSSTSYSLSVSMDPTLDVPSDVGAPSSDEATTSAPSITATAAERTGELFAGKLFFFLFVFFFSSCAYWRVV